MSARPVRQSILLASVAALAVAAAACSATPGPSPSSAPPAASPSGSTSSPQTPSASAEPSKVEASLLLEVTSEGGFINPVANLNALPVVEVYTDGRILTPAPQDAIAPGPLLPTVDVRSVGSAGATAIAAAIHAAGLDVPATAGPGVPGDSGTDVFTVTIDGQTTETRLSGNGPGIGEPGGPVIGGVGSGRSMDPSAAGAGASAGSDAERAAAFALLARLLDPGETWGAAASAPTRYVPAGYRLFAAPASPSGGPSTPGSVAWPLATPLAEFGSPAQPDRGVPGLRQGAVLGADAATVAPLLSAATQDTTFSSGGSSWTLYVRPLLPDELAG